MRYLVTGGSGFVGSHLVEKLIELKNEVTVVDNFSTSSRENLISVANKIELIQGDILDRDLIEPLIAKSDSVLHFAATLGVFNILEKPLESLQVNLKGTENILEFADKYKKSVLMVSSSEIYGKNSKISLSEEDDRIIGHPFIARWAYSEAKAIDESLAYFYFLKNKLPVRIVRLFNTVGPRQLGNYGMVLPRFVIAALNNKPLKVHGTGDQIRCFCHVTDVTNALLKIINSNETVGEVFNVGSDEQVSILNLAKKVIKITKSNSIIEKISYDKAYVDGYEDMQHRVPNISKIKRSIGWEPKIGLEQIIKDIATYYSR